MSQNKSFSRMWLPLILGVIVFAACSSGPSESDIQTAIAQTEVARPADSPTPEPTNTVIPTETPEPTETPLPTASATPESCTAQAAEFLAELDSILTRWDDATSLAGSTARIALVEPIATLQEIRRHTSDLDTVTCVSEIFDQLLKYMDSSIDGYLSFSADDDYLAALYLAIADIQKEGFLVGLGSLDLEYTEPRMQVHYIVTSPFWTAWIKYRDESGKDVGARPDLRLPWHYEFDAEPGAFLSVSSDSSGACAILLNGQLVDIYHGSGQVTCRGNAE